MPIVSGPGALGRSLGEKAFEDRTEADYEDDVSFDEDELRARSRDVRELIDLVKQFVATKQCEPS